MNSKQKFILKPVAIALMGVCMLGVSGVTSAQNWGPPLHGMTATNEIPIVVIGSGSADSAKNQISNLTASTIRIAGTPGATASIDMDVLADSRVKAFVIGSNLRLFGDVNKFKRAGKELMISGDSLDSNFKIMGDGLSGAVYFLKRAQADAYVGALIENGASESSKPSVAMGGKYVGQALFTLTKTGKLFFNDLTVDVGNAGSGVFPSKNAELFGKAAGLATNGYTFKGISEEHQDAVLKGFADVSKRLPSHFAYFCRDCEVKESQSSAGKLLAGYADAYYGANRTPLRLATNLSLGSAAISAIAANGTETILMAGRGTDVNAAIDFVKRGKLLMVGLSVPNSGAAAILNSGLAFKAQSGKGDSYFMVARSKDALNAAEDQSVRMDARDALDARAWVTGIMANATEISVQDPRAALRGLAEGKKVTMPQATAVQNASMILESGNAVSGDGATISVTRMPQAMGASGDNQLNNEHGMLNCPPGRDC